MAAEISCSLTLSTKIDVSQSPLLYLAQNNTAAQFYVLQVESATCPHGAL